MPDRNADLHGNAPDTSPVAVILIDVINDLEFEGGEELLPMALAAAERMRELKVRARAAGIPIIYANDNFGRWRSDFHEVVEHVRTGDVRGRPLAEILTPEDEDYFVLKPKHSAFFATTLETLLVYLGSRRLILTGVTGDICVQFTAQDAYLRDYEIYIPSDCVASRTVEANETALDYMRRTMKADTRPSAELDLDRLRSEPASPPVETQA
jgi:nicotinamidase-related amidase